MELAPVQRKIEARSAEDSFTGFVRTLYLADTYLRRAPFGLRACWRLLPGLAGSMGRPDPLPASFSPVPGSPRQVALASYSGSTTLEV